MQEANVLDAIIDKQTFPTLRFTATVVLELANEDEAVFRMTNVT